MASRSIFVSIILRMLQLTLLLSLLVGTSVIAKQDLQTVSNIEAEPPSFQDDDGTQLLSPEQLKNVPDLSKYTMAYIDLQSEGVISSKTRAQLQNLKPLPGNTEITTEQLLFPHLNYDPAASGKSRAEIRSDGRINTLASNSDSNSDSGNDGDDGSSSGGIGGIGGGSSGGTFEFPPKHKRKILSDSCNNQICKMWQWAMSCKSIGLDLTRECSRYLLGYSFDCPDFPRAKDILTAPSVCLQQMITGLSSLASGEVFNYITDLTDNACGHNCYQQYVLRSREFYLNCYDDIYSPSEEAAAVQAKLPLATLNGFFQEFRNQACTEHDGDFCLDGINAVQATIAAASATAAAQLNIDDDMIASQTQSIYDFQCNYFHQTAIYNATTAEENAAVLSQTCTQMESMQCCAANGVPLVHQSQRALLVGGDGGSFLRTVLSDIFPPCLLRYWQTTPSCSADITTFCSDGAIAKLTTLTATLTIPRLQPKPTNAQLPFPNMYNKTQVLNMMSAVTATLFQLGYSGQPYIFLPTYPFQVQIIDYVYYNATGGQLTPEDGSTYFPPTGDYVQAASGEFTFQLVLQNLNQQQGEELQSVITGSNFQNAMIGIYTGGTAVVTVESEESATQLDANRENVDNAAATTTTTTTVVVVLLSTLLLLLLG